MSQLTPVRGYTTGPKRGKRGWNERGIGWVLRPRRLTRGPSPNGRPTGNQGSGTTVIYEGEERWGANVRCSCRCLRTTKRIKWCCCVISEFAIGLWYVWEVFILMVMDWFWFVDKKFINFIRIHTLNPLFTWGIYFIG